VFEQHGGTVNPFTLDVNTFTYPSGNVAYMTRGERIRTERNRLKWTQAQLAVRVGVTRELISTWEADGVEEIKHSNLMALCRAFGKTVEWVEVGDEPQAKAGSKSVAAVSEDGEVDPARHAELHTLAVDMALAAMVKAMCVNTPAAAVVLRDHLEALAGALKPRPMRSDKGLLGTVLGIAKPIAAEWEDTVRGGQQRASAESKKR
jgi:transcriptional regulator with XRE-family HTH domain